MLTNQIKGDQFSIEDPLMDTNRNLFREYVTAHGLQEINEELGLEQIPSRSFTSSDELEDYHRRYGLGKSIYTNPSEITTRELIVDTGETVYFRVIVFSLGSKPDRSIVQRIVLNQENGKLVMQSAYEEAKSRNDAERSKGRYTETPMEIDYQDSFDLSNVLIGQTEKAIVANVNSMKSLSSRAPRREKQLLKMFYNARLEF
jgi:hypothetical protein